MRPSRSLSDVRQPPAAPCGHPKMRAPYGKAPLAVLVQVVRHGAAVVERQRGGVQRVLRNRDEHLVRRSQSATRRTQPRRSVSIDWAHVSSERRSWPYAGLVRADEHVEHHLDGVARTGGQKDVLRVGLDAAIALWRRAGVRLRCSSHPCQLISQGCPRNGTPACRQHLR